MTRTSFTRCRTRLAAPPFAAPLASRIALAALSLAAWSARAQAEAGRLPPAWKGTYARTVGGLVPGRDVLALAEDRVVLSASLCVAPGCREVLYTDTLEYSVDRAAFPTSASPGNLDLTLRRVLKRPESARGAAFLNARGHGKGFCGIGDWSPGVARDLSGRSCETSFGPTPLAAGTTRLFQILSVDHDGCRLMLGFLEPPRLGATEATRPERLSPLAFERTDPPCVPAKKK